MVGGVGGGHDWLSLLLGTVPGTLIASVTLGVVLLDRATKRANRDGQDAADIQALDNRVSVMGNTVNDHGSVLQQHLIDCAKSQGRTETILTALKEGQERGERTMSEIQRTVANWMRDRERSAS